MRLLYPFALYRFFHIQLSLTNFIIISWTLEMETEAVVFFMVMHYHNIWLAFHITFFP